MEADTFHSSGLSQVLWESMKEETAGVEGRENQIK